MLVSHVQQSNSHIYIYVCKTGGWKKVTQLCLTLCDPMNCSLPGSSVQGILQARILEWVAHSLLQEISPTQGSNPGLLHCTGRFLTIWAFGKAQKWCEYIYILLLFSRSVVSDSLPSHGLLHARLPCPSPSPGACLNSCPLSQWYHPTILTTVIPFSSSSSFSSSLYMPLYIDYFLLHIYM